MMKLIDNYEFKTYALGKQSPGCWFVFPWILFQRDPLNWPGTPEGPKKLMLFAGWWKWQVRIDLNM